MTNQRTEDRTPGVVLTYPMPGAPDLVAWDGKRRQTVPRGEVGQFIQDHADAGLVCANGPALFDYLTDQLAIEHDLSGPNVLWDAAARGRFYDLSLFWPLVCQAENGGGPDDDPAGLLGLPAERLLDVYRDLCTRADRVIGQVGVSPDVVARYGRLGLGAETQARVVGRLLAGRLLPLCTRTPSTLVDACRVRQASLL